MGRMGIWHMQMVHPRDQGYTSPNYSIAKDDEATKTNAAAVSRPLLPGRI